MRNRELFLDCDQVLANFDGRAEQLFGMAPRQARKQIGAEAFWNVIRSDGDFFLKLPVLSEGKRLYDAVKHLRPTILTGTPPEVPEAAAQKREWAAKHFPGTPIITCESADKRNYMHAGDVLVDDWPKYRRLWEEAGGVFILHESADKSIRQVLKLFPDVAREKSGDEIRLTTNSVLLPAEAWFADALGAEQAGDLLRAMQLYEVMIALYPKFVPSYVNLGAIYFQAGNLRKAVDTFKRACDADPSSPIAFFNHGNVLDDLGKIDAAVVAYKKAIALDPGYADAQYNLALIYERQGQTRESLACWRAYFALERTCSDKKAFESFGRNLDKYSLRLVSRTPHPKRKFSNKAALCRVK